MNRTQTALIPGGTMLNRTKTILFLICVLSASISIFADVSLEAAGLRDRGDIRNLPDPLKNRIVEIGTRPHTFSPLTVFSEAQKESQLFAYYLIDSKGFEPNIFTTTFVGINDGMAPTATGPNHDRPTIGSVRIALEPKPGLPTNPKNPEAFIDIFTDISGLFVINNESGWYEGWMIHDLRVPEVSSPRAGGNAKFGTITPADASAILSIGTHHNVPGQIFTVDGNDVHFPGAADHFPDVQTNVVSVFLSMGAYNSLQQGDAHSYWEFNKYTNWVHPLYELPFTGGIPGTFEASKVGAISSIVPGSGPSGLKNSRKQFGDNPNNPRDPDRGKESSLEDADRPMAPNEENSERRLRFVPSGVANEVLLDVYLRVASFEPGTTSFTKRILDAYAFEVARIDQNEDGVISFQETEEEGDDESSLGGKEEIELFLSPTEFNRFAVSREINDGLLAPRFAPSQRAWVLTGSLVLVKPAVAASVPEDDDLR
jgi:hypothetical protein